MTLSPTDNNKLYFCKIHGSFYSEMGNTSCRECKSKKISPKQIAYIKILSKKANFPSAESAASVWVGMGRVTNISSLNIKQAGVVIAKLRETIKRLKEEK